MQNDQNTHRCCPFEIESESLSKPTSPYSQSPTRSLSNVQHGFIYPKLPLVVNIILTPSMSKYGPAISFQPSQNFPAFESFEFRSSN